MESHSLNVLDYNALLEVIGGYAQTSLGRTAVTSLRPSPRGQGTADRRQLYADVLAVLAAGASLPGLALTDPGEALRRVSPADAVLDGPELLLVRGLLDVTVAARAFLESPPCLSRPGLAHLAGRLRPCEDLRADLHRSLDHDGTVLDSASPRLRALRQRAAHLEQSLQRSLERLIKDPGLGEALQETFVTLRNGRFVVPVRREQKGALPGIVHDLSNSGHTLFVEPASAVPLGNDLAETRLQERDEVWRILARLSAAVRAQGAALADALAALTALDAAFAVGRWAAAYHAVLPSLGNRLRLTRARHPLLEWQLRSEGRQDALVPLDFAPADGLRTVVITGSNTGGKTVALKTIGLITALAHAGLPVPVDPDSECLQVDRVVADIGDEQSVTASLSTFSAHLRHLKEIFAASAHGRSLVLIDEIGAGTDPVEGGALACAVLEYLTRRSAFTVATTHLAVVKHLVQENPRMLNASVRFNTETMQPEYTLDLGRPGASHALLIARRLCLPEEVLERADSLLSHDHRRLEKVLSRLEEDQQRLAESEREARDTRDALVRERDAVRAELDELRRERRRLLHDAHRQAEATIENARREVENRLRALREARPDPTAGSAVVQAAAEARQGLDERARRLREGAEQTAPRPAKPLARLEVTPGRRVWVEKLQAYGTVLCLGDHGHTARVEVNGLPFTVEVRDLGQAPPPPDEPRRVTVARPRRQEAAASEVNLLGRRVDEALAELDLAIDRAVLAGLDEIRVVHGFGTGRLRQGIHEWLRTHRQVKRFRLGGEKDPGGAGATIVTLA